MPTKTRWPVHRVRRLRRPSESTDQIPSRFVFDVYAEGSTGSSSAGGTLRGDLGSNVPALWLAQSILEAVPPDGDAPVGVWIGPIRWGPEDN